MKEKLYVKVNQLQGQKMLHTLLFDECSQVKKV